MTRATGIYFSMMPTSTKYLDEKEKKHNMILVTVTWYQQATDIPQATKPYIFFDSKIIGLTAMSATKEPGVVVMFDITLENLSQTIAKHHVTPRSEVLLINAEGQTFAYKDQEKIITE